MTLLQFDPNNKKLLTQFLRFSQDLYAKNQAYVYPLEMTLLGNPLLRVKGLLHEAHPFHRNAKVRYFMLVEGKAVLGRIAVCVNAVYNSFHKTNIGHFGFFEMIDNAEVASMLFDRAVEWFRQEGVTQIHGPCNFSTNETVGLLIEGFAQRPRVGTTYNFPYYQKHLEHYGFHKEIDLLAFSMSVCGTLSAQKRNKRLSQVTKWLKPRYNITTRAIGRTRRDFLHDLQVIYRIYSQVWQDNWGYVPMHEDEFINVTKEMKLFYEPDFIRFAYHGDSPIAFIVVIPDMQELQGSGDTKNRQSDLRKLLRLIFKKRTIRSVRVILFGVCKEFRNKGCDVLLFYECFLLAVQKGYIHCEASWILEENTKMIQVLESLGGEIYKRWRIFSLSV